jgi:phage/plasmid-like protein (TIGR03299 family)
MRRKAGLLWEVEERELTAVSAKGRKSIKIPKHKALVRVWPDGTEEGHAIEVVSGNWRPVTNKAMADFFAKFVEENAMTMETAGSLDDGRIVWMLARIKDTFKVHGADHLKAYLLFSNFTMYGKATDVRTVAERVVCRNTHQIAMSEFADQNQFYRQSHALEFNKEAALQKLALTREAMKKYRDKAIFLGEHDYTDELVKEYFSEVFPKHGDQGEDDLSRNAKRAYEILETQPGHEYKPGTWWQAFNAVSFLTNHELGYDRTRLKSLWYSTNGKVNNKAMEKALEYAEK